MTLSIGGLIKTTGAILVFLGANLFSFGIARRAYVVREAIIHRQYVPSEIQPPSRSVRPTLKVQRKERTLHATERAPVLKKPSIVFSVEPQYSKEAEAAHFSGKVHVSLTVDKDGRAQDIMVLDSPGLGLDAKILEALEKWRFQPGTRNGVPIPITATIEVNFHHS